ncbi:MAG: aminotransferase class V-fold PLP-dependent enzyme [Halieaceae bacterium]|nr:aminotransferase class V-fold PLP-dependent enzyme [Halieaceae bacterium]
MSSAETPLRQALLQPLQQRIARLSSRRPALLTAAAAPLEAEALLLHLRRELIGSRAEITTPFGPRPIIYADYTASGRSLHFLEENIRERVLPFYANTHTEASFTGAQTNALREEARAAIRRSVNGGERDKVIFCGSGATAAINRLIDILGLRLPRHLDERYALSADIPEIDRPVVFVGPYEHHSNELPWRETIAEVVRIGLDEQGRISKRELAAALDRYGNRRLRIGSFSAASNVTGLRSDVPGITRLLKDAGALALWDYAAAAPYVAIDVNLRGAEIDAIFLSPHKFPGGPGTPGVLVAKDALFTNAVPAVVGGGTVSYVSPTEHRFLDDIEHREEGGTPAIIESIRAGAVFALKDRIGADTIEAIEARLIRQARKLLDEVPGIEVLGPKSGERLGIFSLRFRWGDKDLHHGFVAALLNDLFGIQARGGCSCAGPYGHELLRIDGAGSRSLDQAVQQGYESFKPGWVRVNFHYAAPPEEVDYILNALALIGEHGWRLLPSYRLDHARGSWVHRDATRSLPVSLDDLLVRGKSSRRASARYTGTLEDLLNEAAKVLAKGAGAEHRTAAMNEAEIPSELEGQRWFASSAEAGARLQRQSR